MKTKGYSVLVSRSGTKNTSLLNRFFRLTGYELVCPEVSSGTRTTRQSKLDGRVAIVPE